MWKCQCKTHNIVGMCVQLELKQNLITLTFSTSLVYFKLVKMCQITTYICLYVCVLTLFLCFRWFSVHCLSWGAIYQTLWSSTSRRGVWDWERVSWSKDKTTRSHCSTPRPTSHTTSHFKPGSKTRFRAFTPSYCTLRPCLTSFTILKKQSTSH